MLLALVATQVVVAQSTLTRVYDDLEIDIWADRDDGSNYQEGEEIFIYFRASRDCYVTIYDLDTRGNINLLFPEKPDGNNYIVGDEVYQIPGRGADYEFVVTGPPGTEYLQMVAATDPFPVPAWWGPISVMDEGWPFEYQDDNDEFIEQINRHFFPNDRAAFDGVSFYVAPREYYRPVSYDFYGDCGVVYIDYPAGCRVYIDDVYWGLAPLWVRRSTWDGTICRSTGARISSIMTGFMSTTITPISSIPGPTTSTATTTTTGIALITGIRIRAPRSTSTNREWSMPAVGWPRVRALA
jgi:hypothetical protein